MFRFSLLKTYQRIRDTVPSDARRLFRKALVLGFCRSVLDLLGVALVIPVVVAVLQPERMQRVGFLQSLFPSAAENPQRFALAMVIALVGVFAIRALLTWWLAAKQAQAAYDITERISLARFQSYMHMPYRFYTEQNTSVLLRNFLFLPFEFGQRVLMPYVQLVNELLIVAVMLGGMLLYNPLLFLSVVALLAPAFLLFQYTLRRTLKDASLRKDQSSKAVFKDGTQAMELYREIALSGKYNYFKEKFHIGLHDLARINARIGTLNELSPKVIELIAVAGIASVFLYAYTTGVAVNGLVEFLVVFAVVVSRLLPSSNRIVLYTNNIRSNEYAFEHLTSLPQFEIKKSGSAVASLPFKKEIEIKNLTFGYNEAQVLDGLTLTIPKGDTIGIVGPSGSGKTTLLNVLLRLFDEQLGGIYVDGERVTEANRNAWYMLVGFVPQNINLLDADFTQNIAFGLQPDEIDFDKVKEAARRAKILDLIEQSPQGFNTRVGESGIKLSGGQRQRLGIARALYTDAQVLIFDEATSQLDMKTEEQITEAIRSLSHKDLTIIIVAHRVQTLRYCDAIYSIDNGKLGARLHYNDLMKTA